MAKKKSSLVNMLIALFVITLVSGAILGKIYMLTKEPIENAKKAKTENAVKEVLPAFSSLKEHSVEATDLKKGDYIVFREAYNEDGQLVGTAIETITDKGFGGRVKLMVGLLPDMTINKISVLSQAETPGLGAKMTGIFKDQFDGKKVNGEMKVKKDGGDVDAITAATISSRAFCDAVNRAINYYKQEKGE